MESIVSIRNLSKIFDDGEVIALKDLDLDIKKGEFLSVVGPSGSGKSTLLNIIGSLDEPSSGEIMVDGLDLVNDDLDFSKFRSNSVGFVFQFHYLISFLTASENIQVAMSGKGISSDEMKKRAKELLDAVGLANKENTVVSKLSGGESQRVAVARALANNPAIVLADEPTGSLDSDNVNLVLDLLKKFNKEMDVTLVLVTHDMEIANMADRIVHLKEGSIVS